jgi:molybdopterin/thiamine biosynthesis adenylyltransferase/rhodanese-related sulfurtransferase
MMTKEETMFPDLSREETKRYSRHLLLPDVGLDGQRKLKNSSILIVGLGGLGSPAALYLAAAGIGRLGLLDYDTVDASNLQRQVIHGTGKIGEAKVISARDRLADLNPLVEVEPYEDILTSENAIEIISKYDLVLDGTDNFPTRYLLNDACAMLGKPYVYGSIYRFDGQVSVFDAKTGPCYRCLFPDPPPPGLVPTCADGGVLGVLPGTIGTLQATEALKIILGIGQPLIGKLLIYEALEARFQTIQLRKNPHCKMCGEHPEIDHLIDYDEFCGLTNESGPAMSYEISPRDLDARLKAGDPIHLVDVREPVEQQVSKIAGAELIPLGELSLHLDRFKPDEEIVVFCRTGNRSERAAQVLIGAGFTRVNSLRGGINAWASEIEPALFQY